MNARGVQRAGAHDGEAERRQQPTARRLGRRPTPRQRRPDAHQQHDGHAQRERHPLEERLSDADPRAVDGFGDERVERAEQHREGKHGERDVL
jgi:hypothetical protein